MSPVYVVEVEVAERETREVRDTAPNGLAQPVVRFFWHLVSTFADPRDASMLYRSLLDRGERVRWRAVET